MARGLSSGLFSWIWFNPKRVEPYQVSQSATPGNLAEAECFFGSRHSVSLAAVALAMHRPNVMRGVCAAERQWPEMVLGSLGVKLERAITTAAVGQVKLSLSYLVFEIPDGADLCHGAGNRPLSRRW